MVLKFVGENQLCHWRHWAVPSDDHLAELLSREWSRAYQRVPVPPRCFAGAGARYQVGAVSSKNGDEGRCVSGF
jgi:hypothetical protein